MLGDVLLQLQRESISTESYLTIHQLTLKQLVE